MKRSTIAIIGVLVFVVVLLAIPLIGSAGDGYPDGVIVWQLPSGHWCQTVDGVFDQCYCPCESEVEYVCEPCPVPTDEPKSTPTQEPTKVNPTATPTLVPTEAPKTSCNRGVGNGAEDCDPGNSGGKPGSAGEDNE